MEKLKVVIIGPCYPYRGGIATFVAYLSNLLNQHFDVTLINYAMLYPSILFPGKTQYDESKSLVFSFENKRLFSSLNPIAWWRTAKEIKRINPDVIIMDWWQPFFGLCFRGLYLFLPAIFRKRILIVAENVVSHEGRKIDTLLTKLGITIAQAYIVLSDKVKNQIAFFSKDKKIYKSNLPIYDKFESNTTTPITRQQISSQLNDNDFVMLCFGYIRKYKGVDIALEALPLIQQQIPNAKLLIVGESYDDWSMYQDIINQHKTQDSVVVVSEYVPNEAVDQYFNVSDVVLLPYRTATQSGILNIAYGSNKPVVATSVGGFTEFINVGKTGLLVDEITPQAFANGVIDFYCNYHDKINFEQYIQEISAQNSFENIVGYVRDFAESRSNSKK